jgi:hypothetical protein
VKSLSGAGMILAQRLFLHTYRFSGSVTPRKNSRIN